MLTGAHAQNAEQLVQINYDAKLSVDEQYKEMQQRGIANLGKAIVIDLGKHQIEVTIKQDSATSYLLDVGVFEVDANRRVKLSDDSPPYRNAFGVPAQIKMKNEVVELDLSIAVGQPFEKQAG